MSIIGIIYLAIWLKLVYHSGNFLCEFGNYSFWSAIAVFVCVVSELKLYAWSWFKIRSLITSIQEGIPFKEAEALVELWSDDDTFTV